MTMTDTAAPSQRGISAARIVVGLLTGIATGVLALYATSVAANLAWGGGYSVHPLTLVSLAVVVLGAVLIGWRWPVVGLAAGLTVLVVVAVAVTSGLGWVSGGSAFDPFNAVGFTAVSGYPTVVGTVMAIVSVLRLSGGSRR